MLRCGQLKAHSNPNGHWEAKCCLVFKFEAGEVAQWLGALALKREDSSTHVSSYASHICWQPKRLEKQTKEDPGSSLDAGLDKKKKVNHVCRETLNQRNKAQNDRGHSRINLL